jgi:hypothetical protein
MLAATPKRGSSRPHGAVSQLANCAHLAIGPPMCAAPR